MSRPKQSQLRIVEAEPQAGFKVRATLTDGSARILDLRPYLRGPFFEPMLKDPELFNQVRVEAGTLSWPTGQDLCPDILLGTEIAKEGRDMAERVAARWVKEGMPAISTFERMAIYLYPNDHPPAHIHVKYGGKDAQVAISDGSLIKGTLPSSKHKKLKKWLNLRQPEINEAYKRAQSFQDPGQVPPL